jgi:hypothetical protein
MLEVLSGSDVAITSSQIRPKAVVLCPVVKQYLETTPDFKLNPFVPPIICVFLFSLFKSLVCEESHQICWIHPAERRIHHLENDCRVFVKYSKRSSTLGGNVLVFVSFKTQGYHFPYVDQV